MEFEDEVEQSEKRRRCRMTICSRTPAGQERLGVGRLVASAMVAAIGDGDAFVSDKNQH
jgi:hypothetical protein